MLTKKEVIHIAMLARLELTDKEVETFSVQLSKILDYVHKLNEVDTSNVKPTAHAISDIKNRFQEKDNLNQRLSQDDVLKNANESSDGYIQTKAVL